MMNRNLRSKEPQNKVQKTSTNTNHQRKTSDGSRRELKSPSEFKSSLPNLVDDCFCFDTPTITNHVSYAKTSLPNSSATDGAVHQHQSLAERVFALPQQLIFDYISLPFLQFPVLALYLSTFSVHELPPSPLPSSSSRIPFYTQLFDEKQSEILASLREIEEFLQKRFFHTSYSLSRPTSSSSSSTYSTLSPSMKLLLAKLRVLFSNILRFVKIHYEAMVIVNSYTRMGIICAMSGGLVNHIASLGSFLKQLNDFALAPDAQEIPLTSMQHFYYYARCVCIMLRAAGHIESICLKGRSSKYDNNPSFRYFIERFVLSPPKKDRFFEEKPFDSEYYLFTPDTIAFCCLMNIEETSAVHKAFYYYHQSLISRTIVTSPSEVFNDLYPRFLREVTVFLSFTTKDMINTFRQRVISHIASDLILLYKKTYIVTDFLKLFSDIGLNKFWIKLLLFLKDFNKGFEAFQFWYDSMLICIIHCIKDLKDQNNKKQARIGKSSCWELPKQSSLVIVKIKKAFNIPIGVEKKKKVQNLPNRVGKAASTGDEKEKGFTINSAEVMRCRMYLTSDEDSDSVPREINREEEGVEGEDIVALDY